MLWLCISLPQLPLEALHPEKTDAVVVVTDCEGNTRWIVCCNDAAERASLKAPMNYMVALAIHPQLTMLNRKPGAEQASLERLGGWAYQFSSNVVLGEIHKELRLAHTSCIWLEIGASLTLFGGFRRFIEHVEAALKELGYTYQLGIGPTLEGAALLARNGIRVALHSFNALFARIRNLPIDRLTLPPTWTQQLHAVGLRTVGMLLEMPRASIAKRFGPGTSDFLDRLMGEAPDPRIAFRLPAKYCAHFEFEFEVHSTQALLFPVRRMLNEFAGYLRGRDTGVQQFILALEHRASSATLIAIGSSVADRSAERFFSLVRERMHGIDLPEPTIGLSLRADVFSAPGALQNDLLNRSLHEAEDLSHALDRIANRLGSENVHGVKPIADHRPEVSWSSSVPGERAPALQFPDRPLWLLPQPRPLQITHPGTTSGPERIESGWWDHGVQRDYYVVHAIDGRDLWVYQDLRDSNWYLHGFWS